MEADTGPIPELPQVRIIEIEPRYQQAGRASMITIDIPEELGTPAAIFIHTQVDWNVETTYIFGENVSSGLSKYEFFTPLLEGEATVMVNVSTINGSYSVNSSMVLYPKVYINAYTRSPEHQDLINVMLGIDGSIGPVTVYYGVSRTLDIGWGEEGWLMGPVSLLRISARSISNSTSVISVVRFISG